MVKKIAVLVLMILVSISISAEAGIKVINLQLQTQGPNGFIDIGIEGRSQHSPTYKVMGKTIEIHFPDAEIFSPIKKRIHGAELTASFVQGNALVKVHLPYEIRSEGVDLGWKNKNVQVIFPRGKVVLNEQNIKKEDPKNEFKDISLNKEPNSIAKESLNESYLNMLMNEEKEKTIPKKDEVVKDNVSTKMASPASSEIKENRNQSESFSMAGYAVKFTLFLFLVLGLFYGIVQLLKKGVFNRGKLGFLNNSQLIQVLSTTYVAPKKSILLIKAHKQVFLLSNSENGIQFLSELSDTSGLIKEGEKMITGTNFDVNLQEAESITKDSSIKLKENINDSTPIPEERGIQALTAKDIVKFSDELKKKVKKLRPIEFN